MGSCCHGLSQTAVTVGECGRGSDGEWTESPDVGMRERERKDDLASKPEQLGE